MANITNEFLDDLRMLSEYESMLDRLKISPTDKFEFQLFANILIFLKKGGSIEECEKHMKKIIERNEK
jgi:hypothetical protein